MTPDAIAADLFCRKYKIKNCTIHPDGVIDVDGSVRQFPQFQLGELPVQFGRVTGEYRCHKNFTSLKGSPHTVLGNFDVGGAQITSLEGSPQFVGGGFYCPHRDITSLEGAPRFVGGSFACQFTPITSLQGSPDIVGGGFYCHCTDITSFDGLPRFIGESIWCFTTKIAKPNLSDFWLLYKVQGLQEIKTVESGSLNRSLDTILNMHLESGEILALQDTLIDANYIDEARLRPKPK